MGDIKEYLKKADEAMQKAKFYNDHLPMSKSENELQDAAIYHMLETITYQNQVIIEQNQEAAKQTEKTHELLKKLWGGQH